MGAETRIVEVAVEGVKGFLFPTDAERAAAYELLIELTTRPSSAPLASSDVTLTEELRSVAELFDLTREILRKHGTDSSKGSAGNLSLAVVALRVLNEVYRPVIDRWQPALDEHFARRPEGGSAPTVQEWERRWERATQCRAELNAMRSSTRGYIETLSHIAGTPAVADAVLGMPSSTVVPAERIDESRHAPEWDVAPREQMVRWFAPVEMFKTWRSTVHGLRSERRARNRTPIVTTDDTGRLVPTARFVAEADEEFWFDYVADFGDGFDGTAPVAWMMGRRELRLPDRDAIEVPTPPAALPRAELVVFGGDEVYPYADEGFYEAQAELPFRMGLEGGPDGSDPTLVAIPGNHDWMGGIEHFERVFASGRRFADHWSTPQRNPWWHVALPQGWWLWGIDTGLRNELVGPQEEYFRHAAMSLRPGDRVILCTPVPLWQLRAKHPRDYATLRSTFDPIIAGANATMPLCLSGDTHIFAHLERVDTDSVEDHVTSGGGGAFLQPTHNLPERVPLERGNAEFRLTSRWPLPADSRSIAPGATRIFSVQYWPLLFVGALLQLGMIGLAGLSMGRFAVTIANPDAETDPDAPARLDVVTTDTPSPSEVSVEDLGLLDLLRWVAASPFVWVGVLLIAVALVVAFRGNSVEPKLGAAAKRYGVLAGGLMGGMLLAVSTLRLAVSPPLAYWPSVVAATVIGGVLVIAAFLGATKWVNRRIKAADTLAFSPAHSTRFKHFVRFRIDRDGDLTCFVIGMDPVGAGWYQAMTPTGGATSSVPPYDPAGTPRLHYVWGKTYEKFMPVPMEIALSISNPKEKDGVPASLDSLTETFVQLSGELIDGGHTLTYGGLPDVGVTARLHEVDRARHVDNPNWSPHLVNYVADVFWRDGDGDAAEADGIRREHVGPGGGGPGEDGRDETVRLVTDLTAMRRTMTEHAGMRVVIGGSLRPGLPGTRMAPGVLEEAYLALEAGLPLVIAGGFGGVGELIAKGLLGKLDRRSIDAMASHFMTAERVAEIDSTQVTFGEMIQRFRSIGELRNGLTTGENLELLRSQDPDTVSVLVLRSVHRIAGTR